MFSREVDYIWGILLTAIEIAHIALHTRPASFTLSADSLGVVGDALISMPVTQIT